MRVNNIIELEKLLGFKLSRYYSGNAIVHQGVALSGLASNLNTLVAKADGLAIEDACKLISCDPHLPFGKLIKSNLARALKKCVDYVSKEDRNKIVTATAKLLNLDFCPRETEDYCKLVKKFGCKEVLETLSLVKPINKKSKLLVLKLEDAT